MVRAINQTVMQKLGSAIGDHHCWVGALSGAPNADRANLWTVGTGLGYFVSLVQIQLPRPTRLGFVGFPRANRLTDWQ
jgi:hypothetical protein